MMRAAAYFVGALGISTIVHFYLNVRLDRDTGSPRKWRVASTALAALLPAGMIGLLAMRDLPRTVAAPLMWCAFSWLGILLYLLPLVLAGEVARAVPTDPSRRRAIARAVAGASGAAALALGATSATIAQLAPIVRRFRVPLRGLKTGRLTIVQLSDIHVSATIGRALVESLVDVVVAIDPDLVAITGDLADGSVRELGPLVAPLARLRPKNGVWFVTGNHEYLSGAEEWLAFLPSLGVRILRNEHVSIGDVDLIGVDDSSGANWIEGHGTDLEKALRGRDPARPSILLAHRPDDVRAAAAHNIGLQLSGHTHGGQVPVWWAIERLRQPFVYGLHRVENTILYVTSGAGYWGPPMRLGSRAEIAVFELVPDE